MFIHQKSTIEKLKEIKQGPSAGEILFRNWLIPIEDDVKILDHILDKNNYFEL